ncbi:efflux transporter outer membrane subunit [Fulvivirga sp. 29W222]|uniref:Efflux transporter outer membrane subunit n=1 Tax=Fulvivirga marina TaxID=2494733 RepID=A0A937G319_9BACT|nr:efflux transporter outer membrane subunit [Fulvivirga marina]MBL6447521.1 efflux transporter outer membrane subunit [Fulvivirga marina]
MQIRNIYTGLSGLVLAVILSSCLATKNYNRSEIEIEGLYKNFTATDSTTLANIPWQDLFPDEYLNKLIGDVLANNQDIGIAAQRIVAARAYFKQKKLEFLPSVGVGASVTHQELAENSQFGSFFNGSIDQYQLAADLSWEADIWGKIRSNKRAYYAAYMQSEAAYRVVQTKLIASVASTYYQLLALDAQLIVAEETVENRTLSLETMKSLKEAGKQTEVSVKQSEAQLYGAQILETDLKKQIQIVENTLSLLLGEVPQEIERGELEEQELDVDINVGLPAQLMRNRPDIIEAEYGLVQAFELTNVARTQFYPSLTLSATGGFQSIEFDNWFDTGSLFATIVGGLTQPIFNQGKIKAQYKISQAEQEQALLNFRKSVLNAGREVSNAMVTITAESEKYDLRLKQRDALSEAVTYSEELLINGYASYLEVLTAKDNELSAELNLIDTQYKKLTAIVDLYQALGGGWKQVDL